MNRSVKVIESGMYTTVQDQGRPGYLRYGLPAGGVMDRSAFVAANKALGNNAHAAVLEVTGTMPVLECMQPMTVAIAGMDGVHCFEIKPGRQFKPEPLQKGYRACMAFEGGIDVPLVMGSRSTYVPGRIGGLGGRPLKAGDIVPIGQGGSGIHDAVLSYPAEACIRVMPGPEAHWFDCEGLQTFLGTSFSVSSKSDRIGLRLAGRELSFRSDIQMVSAALSFGTIQVPPSGLPIIMMADHPTTGGYPRIGNVVVDDLPRLAQLRPNDAIRFVEAV